ncbi:hypothetical protein QJS10_CPB18g00790 [Acorus calamus]|uniref:Mitochondrial transcription termination factor family protein n=1 Tax=Acorus calamus TaxID=4465 RepID=A0AAV9CPM3_ACOCL|nr:hypothetical protein QJS10_CPB18g00790 [Acorus calamus]
MLGRSIWPGLTYESTAYSSSYFLGVSASSPCIALLKPNSSHSITLCIRINPVRQRTSMSCNNWRLHALEKTKPIHLPEGEEKATWEECKQSLSALEFEGEEADVILSKAYGWDHSPYWGEERTKQVPRNESVNEILNYMRNLGLSDEDLHKVLKKFPEVLGCDLEEELKVNVGLLQSEWGIKGKQLRSLLRNPKVLGYNVDCKGDCIAKCTRCWVRF